MTTTETTIRFAGADITVARIDSLPVKPFTAMFEGDRDHVYGCGAGDSRFEAIADLLVQRGWTPAEALALAADGLVEADKGLS